MAEAMQLDLDDPVIRLLSEGASIEAARPNAAHDLYLLAWEAASNDYQACMAAHYVARAQDSARERFRWNAVALDRALAVSDGRAAGFLPSLYLNMGRSFEDVGRTDEARDAYRNAAGSLAALAADPYRAVLEEAIGRAIRRTAAAPADS